jgi:predicted NBD/HSP70 family sugar kinase
MEKAAASIMTEPPVAVAVGVPGPLTVDKTAPFSSPNLPGWRGRPLKAELERIFNTRVTIENDTALVGLGEAHAGAGQGFGIVVYFTVSTGVGGVRIVDGQIDRNARGFEPGWQIIDIDGSLLKNTPAPHRLEHLIGGASVAKRYNQQPKDVDDPAVWDQCADWLAVALNNALVFWSPDIIIVGGPMMNDIPLEKTRARVTQLAGFLPNLPPIAAASLGDRGGLFGGLALLQQEEPNNKE